MTSELAEDNSNHNEKRLCEGGETRTRFKALRLCPFYRYSPQKTNGRKAIWIMHASRPNRHHWKDRPTTDRMFEETPDRKQILVMKCYKLQTPKYKNFFGKPK